MIAARTTVAWHGHARGVVLMGPDAERLLASGFGEPVDPTEGRQIITTSPTPATQHEEHDDDHDRPDDPRPEPGPAGHAREGGGASPRA